MGQAVIGIPMTPAQQGLWFAERSGSAAAAYLVPAVLTTPHWLAPEALDRAWSALVDRHPLLAAVVAESTGEPLLIQGDPIPVKHRTISAADLATVLAAELAAQFDFTGRDSAVGPFARCVGLRVDDGRTVVLIIGHHLVLDASGRDLVTGDLATAVAGRPLERGSLAVFAQLGQAQAERIAAALPAARAFWSVRPVPPDERH